MSQAVIDMPKWKNNRVVNVWRFARDPLAMLVQWREQYGDFVSVRVGPRRAFVLNHPVYIQHVLQTNNRNYRKGRGLMRARAVLGDGLLTNHGDSWLMQRRLMQPAFHRQHLAGLASVMTGCAEDIMSEWQGKAITGESFDMAQEMMHLTLRIVGSAMFTTEVGDAADSVSEAMDFVLTNSVRRVLQPEFFERLPLPINRRFMEAVAELDRVVYGIIGARRGSGEDHSDLLGMLMAAQDEATGAGMSDQQLRDEVMTIFLAGHETTANLLTWTWYVLAQHPAQAEELRAELKSVLNGRLPAFDDLPNLPYTRMVIEETMRLYPPAWVIGRQAIEDDVVAGHRIPAGSVVMVSPYVMHHHPDYWTSPEEFNPLYFEGEKAKSYSRFVYFPFGGGPRVCIGNNFALMEAQLVLATLAQHFQPRLVEGHPVEMLPAITLRPKHGMMMSL